MPLLNLSIWLYIIYNIVKMKPLHYNIITPMALPYWDTSLSEQYKKNTSFYLYMHSILFF